MVVLGTGYTRLTERWDGLGPEQSLEVDHGTFEIANEVVQTINILNEKIEKAVFTPKVLRPGEVVVKLSMIPNWGNR